MHKFTIFTLLFSVTIVAIIADLIFNNYLDKPLNQTPKKAETIVEEEVAEPTAPPIQEEEPIESTITTNLLSGAGFLNSVLETVPFSGKLFQIIEPAGVDPQNIFKINIFEDKDFAATTYEIPFPEAKGAKELYSYLKTQISAIPEATINESNSFGEQSFYLNIASEKKTVFLVVQLKNSVFAFEYPHKSHSKIIKLIPLL